VDQEETLSQLSNRLEEMSWLPIIEEQSQRKTVKM